MSYSKVVAIDGPCGSGKSAIAKQLACKLNVLYVDTGAMFRALGYWFHDKGIAFNDATGCLGEIDFYYGRSHDCLVEINGINLTEIIREHYVSELASKISKMECVRTFLLHFQRRLATKRICVMEGRDIGTVVFPDAFCKIFLTASVDVRAQRRLDQLRQKGDDGLTFEQVAKDIELRDLNDTKREIAPLKQADDAYLLDSSDMNIEEVLEKMDELVQDCAARANLQL